MGGQLVGRSGRGIAYWAGVCGLQLALALLALRPTPERWLRALTPDLGDPLFSVYLLDWGAERLREGLAGFWDAPFFYPTRRTITLSEALIGPAVLTAVVEAVGGGPVVAYNTLLVLSFVLTGLATTWLLRCAGLPPGAAIVGGVLFAFLPYRLDQLAHVPMLWAATVPLLIGLWDRLLQRPGFWTGLAFVGAYTAHLGGGAYLIYIVHVPLAVILVHRWLREPRLALWRRRLAVLAPVAAVCGTLLMLLARPYGQRPPEVPITRFLGEWREFGASLASFVTPSTFNWYVVEEPFWQRPENAFFPGFLGGALAIAGLLAVVRRRKPSVALSPVRRWTLNGLLVAVAVGVALGELHTWTGLDRFSVFGLGMRTDGYKNSFYLVLAALTIWLALRRRWRLGWPWTWREGSPLAHELLLSGAACLALSFPLVFEPLAQVVPKLDHLRAPARFWAVGSLAVAWLAARGWQRLAAAPLGRRRLVLCAVPVLLVAELLPKPLAWNPVPRRDELPPSTRWLAQHGEVRALLELPMGNPAVEIRRLYLQRFHGRPLVNGFSGYFPPFYRELEAVRRWPDATALEALRRAGVTHLFVHVDENSRRRWRRAVRRMRAEDGLRRVYRGTDGVIFQVEPGLNAVPRRPLKKGPPAATGAGDPGPRRRPRGDRRR